MVINQCPTDNPPSPPPPHTTHVCTLEREHSSRPARGTSAWVQGLTMMYGALALFPYVWWGPAAIWELRAHGKCLASHQVSSWYKTVTSMTAFTGLHQQNILTSTPLTSTSRLWWERHQFHGTEWCTIWTRNALDLFYHLQYWLKCKHEIKYNNYNKKKLYKLVQIGSIRNNILGAHIYSVFIWHRYDFSESTPIVIKLMGPRNLVSYDENEKCHFTFKGPSKKSYMTWITYWWKLTPQVI